MKRNFKIIRSIKIIFLGLFCSIFIYHCAAPDFYSVEDIEKERINMEKGKNKSAEINLLINSPGGNVHEMFGIIDYIESLDVKVNTICRGRAFSAAAIILLCGTGNRMISKRSTVMFHQTSSFLGGKMSDITAYLDNVKTLELSVYELLAEKTKNADFVENGM